MKGLNLTANKFHRVKMSRERFKRNLQEVITIMIEFRDKHGHDERAAIQLAVDEHIQGLDECAEMQESGHWKADETERLYCKFLTK